MNKQEYQEYLKSGEWSAIRKAVLVRDQYRCRVCNSGLDLNVHHRSYQFIGREMEHLTDLVTLCHRCHSIFHGKSELARPRAKRKLSPSTIPDIDIPDGDPIVLTRKNLNNLSTVRGGFTKATLDALGAKMKKGWLTRLTGTTIPRDQYIAAANGRFKRAS